jgi:squalene-hopene/tetraprenyl-beta-curcumene cyclase
MPMKSQALWAGALLSGVIGGVGWWRATPVLGASGTAPASQTENWNRQTAAAYLDSREVWWQDWKPAQRDHETICISCHTVLPYALARPALRQESSQTAMAGPEKIMMDNIEKRVSHWSEMVPFYSDAGEGKGKTAESHSTEAVLNAVILSSYDARQGHLRPVTRTALDAAWALQQETGENAGGWIWQDFHLSPWESTESAYQGAALLMVQVGNAPDGYASEAGVRGHVEQLRDYLRRAYAAQPLMSQLYILWASPKVPGLLTDAERKTLVESIEGLQQADGGWRLASLDKKQRSDDTAQPVESDGVATGLAVLALEQSGTGRSDKTLARGVAWLGEHQSKDGNWVASSLNKQRDPATGVGHFMSDAATGYAVLALEQSR